VKQNFKGYQLREDLTFEASPETKTLNYDEYINLLKSKASLIKEEDYQWIFEGQAKLLDAS